MGNIFSNQIRQDTIQSDLVYDNAVSTVEWEEMKPTDFVDNNALVADENANQPAIGSFVVNGSPYRRYNGTPQMGTKRGTAGDPPSIISGIYAKVMVYAYVEAYYYIGSTTFPKYNGLATVLGTSKRPDGTNNFNAIARCYRQTGSASANNVSSATTIRDSTSESWGSSLADAELSSNDQTISATMARSYSHSGLLGITTASASQTVTVSLANQSTLRTAAIVDNGNSFTVNYMCLVGYKRIGMNAALGGSDLSESSFSSVSTGNGGFLERYVPSRLEISFMGQVRKIDLTSKIKRSYTNGKQGRIITMRTNDFFTTIPITTPYGSITRGELNARNIIGKWQKGKQSIRLTKEILSVSDIEQVRNSAKVINVNEQSFTNENTQSIAKNPDGTAKNFDITRAKFVYDGSRSQEVDMLEKT